MVVKAVVLDVGGTLWPDRPTHGSRQRRDQVLRLCELNSGLSRELADRLVEDIETACAPVVDGGPQPTTEIIADVVRRHHLDPRSLDPVAVRRALSPPFAGHQEMLQGAADMVRGLADDGVALAVVSNTVFRDAECYWGDFAAVGLDGFLSGIVTSVDVGWRKPHLGVFDAALALTGVPANRTAMVGNSERCDIVPALELGMTAILVAIEEPPPVFSRADAVAVSLKDVPAIVRLS